MLTAEEIQELIHILGVQMEELTSYQVGRYDELAHLSRKLEEMLDD